MSNILIPAKTPLGQDELRSRTLGLSQRHRTVLLLADGSRPLGEVLRMAQQAGAQTVHFEELMRLGMIEMPARSPGAELVETVPDLSIAPPTGPMELDEPEITEVVLPPVAEVVEEPAEELAEAAATPRTAAAEPAPAQAHHDTELPLPAVSRAVVPVESPVITPAMTPAMAPAIETTPPAPVAAAVVRYQTPTLALSEHPRVPRWIAPVADPADLADHMRPVPKLTEEERLKFVRNLLMDVLRNDNLLFSTFSVARVRNAQTQREMINLIWEIERDRVHLRRSREQLNTLQRARELLGMGNTHVAGDSQPPPMASDF